MAAIFTVDVRVEAFGQFVSLVPGTEVYVAMKTWDMESAHEETSHKNAVLAQTCNKLSIDHTTNDLDDGRSERSIKVVVVQYASR